MASCDPNFNLVSLLCHCDGTAGSTSFPDASSNALTATVHGTAQVETTTIQFGSGALSAGTGYVSFPVTANGPLDLSTGDFTVECWFNASIYNDDLIFDTTNSGVSSGFFIEIPASPGPIFTAVWNGSTQVNVTSPSVVIGQWYALAFVRSGNNFTVFINGVGGTPTSISGSTGTGSTFNIGGGFRTSFNGVIDEVRVTKGLARYTANYTPSGPFANISCTQSVPNLVGDTATQAIAANTAAGYVTTVQEANHPTVPAGIVISQQPPAGTLSVIGTNVILQLSVGPVTTAGMGGDVWGSTGGGNIQAQGQTPIGQALAYATQRDNAVVQGNQSVLAALATGAVNPTSAVATNQSTPAINIPTSPTVG
jgi:hypothetical protein